jgi:hypothetical protein
MRKLVLNREHLAELTTGELGVVVGASGLSCPIAGCAGNVSAQLALCASKVAACDSLLRPCIDTQRTCTW